MGAKVGNRTLLLLVCETQQYLAVHWLVTVTYETMHVTFSVVSCIQRQ